MDQQHFSTYLTWEDWIYIRDNYLDTPEVGIVVLLALFLTALYLTFKKSAGRQQKTSRLQATLSAFSSKERLQQSFEEKKQGRNQPDLLSIAKSQLKTSKMSSYSSQLDESKKELVRSKYLRSPNKSLFYETEAEKREKARKEQQELEERNAKEKRRQMEEQKAREKQRQKEARQKEKESLQKQKAEQANPNKKKVGFAEDQSSQLQSEKSVRSGERKTTIQLAVDANEKKESEAQPQAAQSFSLFNNPSLNQISPLFNIETSPGINPSSTTVTPKNVTLSTNAVPSIKVDVVQPPPPKINFATTLNQPSLFQNMPKPQNNVPPKDQKTNIVPAAPAQPAPRQQVSLSGEEYLDQVMKFAQRQTARVEIATIMANLGGAKSSLNDLLTFAQSFIDTINKGDDSQLTAFAVKIYEGILRQISTSNLKDGIYRIPPKSKTDQVQKNSINCYILYINLYRLMGHEKVWTIVFGKLLKLLQFVYKRKTDLKNFTQLELIANKHLEKKGQLQGKYLSRIDYLTYLLFGLTAFDPVMVFRQTEEKQPNVRGSREQVESWGRQWNYKEFWILTDLFMKNKHDSYFKPILYMNILSVLYPRIYSHKLYPEQFRAENQLYKIILEQGKKYFAKFKTIPQLKALKESDEGAGFEYDGDNFLQDIKVLESRLTVEKVKQFNVRLGDNYANARDFEVKSNVLYYFSKEK